jgi:hypothetical protein
MRARDRGRHRRGDRGTNVENAYGDRRPLEQADDADERDEGGIGAFADVAHLACAIAFTLVMHRTDLAGQESRTAFFVVVRGGGGLAAERERRGDHAGDLACEPDRDHPRDTAAHREHLEYQLSMRIAAIIGRGRLISRAIQFAVLLITVCLPTGRLAAQDRTPVSEQTPDHRHMVMAPADAGWTWTTDATIFVGYNYQQRLFADFSAAESQNWFMLAGSHKLGAGRLTATGMLSLEPLTIGRLVWAGDGNPQRAYARSPSGVQVPFGGSPQLFQTGESYQDVPLVNVQHPHDLIMGLGATYRIVERHATYVFGADLVGSPTLGPTPFMHRESARDNPQVPLTHHDMDSTHISEGVVRAGVETGPMTFEASVFRGEEPDQDDNRYNIEKPALDSWAARVGWHRGPWQAQLSGGRLRKPEWFEPYETTRITASVAFDGDVASRPLSATLGWGHHHEDNGFDDHADGYLLEWDFRVTERTAFYGRTEVSAKQIFGLGLHPAGFNHPHFYSHIDPLTLGVVRDIAPARWGRLGIGADATVYRMSQDMIEFFDGSRSFHVFLRWRPARTSSVHVH